jgi:sortase A
MRALRFIGKLLISLGVGVLLFVLWTLYGTGIQTAREQSSLSQEFAKQPDFEVSAPPKDPSSPYRSPPASFDPGSGDPVFRLRIPKIRLNDGKGYIVVEGVDVLDLEKGPGHYPSCGSGFTPPLCTEFPETWPGEKGRVVVSGHRTTHGAPFYHVDQLNRGDKIFVDTKWGDFVYEVTEQEAVLPDDPNIVIEKDDDAELVLTTCNPPYSASQRLITYARMVTT